ncbi:ADP-glyceromanno-heptose 6-epimerase [Carboxylicivirga taeanensis]|uniref:ADP-glyceromanno-heptose 6-epimerase n=1 Tax=Carboxylicivirga taeanensis TaxID=1416875 RepID=UPI003F6E3A2E
MIIVTGGAGFIGSNIVKGLNDKGIDNILIVDNLGETQKYLNMNRLRFSDFINKQDFLKLLPDLKNVEAIIHQGACSATTELDGNYLIRNNYEYSKTLLHYALDKKVPFIYASSASVYGNGENGFSEKADCEYPLNGYAFSKFIFDNYVRQNVNFEKDSPVVGLRYFNVYGYQENHKGSMASVPFHFFNQAQESGKIKVFEGSEHFLRDFIFIEDVVKVVLFFLESKKSGIYNCGTGEERSFMDMASIFANIYGQCEINQIPFPDHLKGKYQAFTKADTNKLRAAGYKNKFLSLEKGMEKYLSALIKYNGFL